MREDEARSSREIEALVSARGRRSSRTLNLVKKLLGAFALVSSALLAVICIAAVKWYLFDVLIGLRGEPDQSMQFWGLAILFIGIWAGGGAIGLAVLSRKLLTRNGPGHTNLDGQRLAVESHSLRGGTAR